MEQRVLWELNRWQETRHRQDEPDAPAPPVSRAPAVPREQPAARGHEPPRVAAAPEAAPAAPRHLTTPNGAAAAMAYDLHADVGTAEAPPRPDLPLVVRRLPISQTAPAPVAGAVVGSVAPEIADDPIDADEETRAGKPIVEVLTPPVKESRKERKARERAQRDAEEAAQRQAEEVEREEARRRKAEAAGAAEAKRAAREAERAQRDAERDAERAQRDAERRAKPSRSDRRDARKHRRLTEGITLHDGETITLTLSGWSRGRPAVLVITRYRVALITKLPHSLRWIPLEEVSKAALRWRGGWTLEIEGSVEYLTLQKRHKQTLIAIRDVLSSEVAEARAPGGRRHHAEVTQDWCDRSIEMWESHAGQIRLFIRRHPALVVLTLSVWVPVAYYFALR